MTSLRRLILPILPILAIVCYITAFFLPALYLTGQANTTGEHTDMVGLAAFFDGFFGLFDRQYAWLANPLAALALILLFCRLRWLSLVFSVAALLFAQHTWVLPGTQIWGDEGGVTKYLVTSLGIGYYLWCFSFLLLAVASLVARFRPVDQPDAIRPITSSARAIAVNAKALTVGSYGSSRRFFV